MARDLQVVLKVAERCNINCSYCYYLNSDNDAPYKRPPFVTDEVAESLVRFVEQSATDIVLGNLRIVLHGGEPLMLKKSRFRSVCRILSQLKKLKPGASIVITTNAILIDEQWIEIFEEFQLGICVSLDGPREYHDRERVDFARQGTYERVVAGIEKLKRAAAAGRIADPSVLCVIDPRARGEVVYDHLIRQLGFRRGDFLVPMTIYDKNPKEADIRAVGRFLVAAFSEWVKDDDPTVRIRIFEKYMNRLLHPSLSAPLDSSHIIVGVGSDGTMVNDDLMQILGSHIFDRNLNVSRNSMNDYLAEVSRGELAGVYHAYHECVQCPWFNVCRPSTVPWEGAEMRYKRSTGFQNKLVHCEAYQELFRAMAAYICTSSTVSPVRESYVGGEATETSRGSAANSAVVV